MKTDSLLVLRVDDILPQTQCTQCGYAGCLPYAHALVEGKARINQCPPGGQFGVDALACLLDQESLPLDPEFGPEKRLDVVVIEEEHCIGCTLCIAACPVDAIVGASKQMHTVLTELCTGCMLCVAPCPVDCIQSLPAPFAWDTTRARAARDRFHRRNQRLEEQRQKRRQQGRADPSPGPEGAPALPVWDSAEAQALHRQQTIERAVRRARERRLAGEQSRIPPSE